MPNLNDHITAENLRIKGRIIPLLGWSEEEYQSFKMRSGCRFMQEYMPNYPDLVDEVILNPVFWKWWCNQWALRDKWLLLSGWFETFETKARLDYYRFLHGTDNLMEVLVVDSIVFENTSITQKPAI